MCTGDDVVALVTSAFWLLVSTYVVCERLSVMHKLAGVVENLVQKSQFTLFWDLVPRIPPPPPKIEIKAFLGILRLFNFYQWRIPPLPPPPPPKIEI